LQRGSEQCGVSGLILPALTPPPNFPAQPFSQQVNRLRKQGPQNVQRGLLVTAKWQELVAAGPQGSLLQPAAVPLLAWPAPGPCPDGELTTPTGAASIGPPKGLPPNTCALLLYRDWKVRADLWRLLFSRTTSALSLVVGFNPPWPHCGFSGPGLPCILPPKLFSPLLFIAPLLRVRPRPWTHPAYGSAGERRCTHNSIYTVGQSEIVVSCLKESSA